MPVDDTHDLVRVDATKEAPPAAGSRPPAHAQNRQGDGEGGGVLRILWESTQFSVALKPPASHVDFPAASPAATLRQRIGLTDIEVVYSRPSLRGRAMIGGIDPYGEVWRTGANSATRVTFSTPVSLQGTPVAAGTYELFTIPRTDEWTIILQKPSKQWGAYSYDSKNDVVRVNAKAESLTEPVETFTIEFNNLLNESGTLDLAWGRVRVPVAIQGGRAWTAATLPDRDGHGLPWKKAPKCGGRYFLFGPQPGTWKTALGWINAAIDDNPKAFYFIYQKARILQKLGDKAGRGGGGPPIDRAGLES